MLLALVGDVDVRPPTRTPVDDTTTSEIVQSVFCKDEKRTRRP